MVHPRHAVAFVLLCAAIAASAGIGQAASSSVTVTLSVASATTLGSSGCASDTPDVTNFGTVLPGAAVRTGSDCVVQFGSTNDTATLRMARSDPNATAMRVWAPAAMPSGTVAAINGFVVADRTTTWVVGNGGLVRRTADGGQSWTAQTSNLTAKLNAGTAVSDQEAWVVGNVGAIARTTDGGATWTDISYATTSDITDIEAIDEQTLLAVGGQTAGAKLALRSTDGGTTWSDVSHASMDNQHAIDMVNDSRGWTVGQADFVHRTDDGGLTWTAYPLCTTSQMRGVAALSTSVVVAVGHVGSICRSTDGGQTWSSVSSGTAENLWDVQATPDGALWAVTRGTGLVLRSLDEGVTWQQVAIANESLEEVAAFDRDSAWWSGWNGLLTRIPSGSFPEYASAAGATWAGTASMFGTCLSAATNATPVWTPDAGCAMSDGAHWRAVPPSTADAASRVATSASGVTNGEARLRFGARPSASTPAGRYVASLVFEVLAPST